MLLFIDTETSGLYRPDLTAADPTQPWPVQVALHLFTEDWKRRGTLVSLIRPEGRTIQADAAAVHGITLQRASRSGIPLESALTVLQGWTVCAHTIIGHGVQFDRGIIRAALHQVGASGVWWDAQAKKFRCTMEALTPIMELPGLYGSKQPSLDEAHRYITRTVANPEGDPFEQAHDAEHDLGATIRVARWLYDRGVWQHPQGRTGNAV